MVRVIFLLAVLGMSGCATTETINVHSITILPSDAQGAQYQAAQTLFEKGYQTSLTDPAADARLSVKVTESPVKIEATLVDVKQGHVLWSNSLSKQKINLKDPLSIPSMTASVLRSFPQNRGTKPLITPIGQPKLAPAITEPLPVVAPPPVSSKPTIVSPKLNFALSPAANKALAGTSINIPISTENQKQKTSSD